MGCLSLIITARHYVCDIELDVNKMHLFWANHLLQIKFLIQLCDMQTTLSFVGIFVIARCAIF